MRANKSAEDRSRLALQLNQLAIDKSS